MKSGATTFGFPLTVLVSCSLAFGCGESGGTSNGSERTDAGDGQASTSTDGGIAGGGDGSNPYRGCAGEDRINNSCPVPGSLCEPYGCAPPCSMGDPATCPQPPLGATAVAVCGGVCRLDCTH